MHACSSVQRCRGKVDGRQAGNRAALELRSRQAERHGDRYGSLPPGRSLGWGEGADHSVQVLLLPCRPSVQAGIASQHGLLLLHHRLVLLLRLRLVVVRVRMPTQRLSHQISKSVGLRRLGLVRLRQGV